MSYSTGNTEGELRSSCDVDSKTQKYWRSLWSFTAYINCDMNGNSWFENLYKLQTTF